ncbi:hypothetical protein L209DRAFT_612617, partial [Thermothelomyces heterothallicus CBS 203.75]
MYAVGTVWPCVLSFSRTAMPFPPFCRMIKTPPWFLQGPASRQRRLVEHTPSSLASLLITACRRPTFNSPRSPTTHEDVHFGNPARFTPFQPIDTDCLLRYESLSVGQPPFGLRCPHSGNLLS